MKKLFRIFILSFVVYTCSIADTSEDFLNRGNTLYERGKKEDALKWYYKSAIFGNADAYFNLAYLYIVTEEEAAFYFSKAAEKGHEKALKYALDSLLFRANNPKVANPKKALEVYKKAKKANPHIKLYAEKEIIATMKKCSELDTFDIDDFIKKYNLKKEIKVKEKSDNFFYILEYAEEASKGGGRFGEKNPELALNLICHGSWVPYELISAVENYDSWKQDDTNYNLCDYITEKYGGEYCKSRDRRKEKSQKN